LDPVAPAVPAREDTGAATRTRLHGQAHVLVHGEVGEQVGELEGAANAQFGSPRRAKHRHVHAVDQNAAGCAWELHRGSDVEVVLPAPLGPTMAVSVPAGNTALTLWTATWPPKRMVRPLVSKTGLDMPPPIHTVPCSRALWHGTPGIGTHGIGTHGIGTHGIGTPHRHRGNLACGSSRCLDHSRAQVESYFTRSGSGMLLAGMVATSSRTSLSLASFLMRQ